MGELTTISTMARGFSRMWLAIAAAVSALLVLGAPFVGQVTTTLRDVARANYAAVLAAIVLGTAGFALAIAVYRIRDRRAERYGWLAAAVVIAVGYALASRSGVADQDAAERFHFIEYGLVAVLFYKAWRPADDGSILIMPVLAGFAVGTIEEWLQWFVPGRVGELRDVLLNLIAVGCGVLFSLGLDPPPRLSFALRASSRPRVGALAAFAIVVLAVFFQSVHLGHDVVDKDAGVFRSRYSASELAAVSADRVQKWRTDPPLTTRRLSREDQYLSEGIAHVRRRNERWAEGNLHAARQENLILEKYYAPVLDTPSYLASTSHRWADAQRAQAESASGPGFMIYDSDALPYPVFTWPKWAFWMGVGAVVAMVLRGLLRAHRV
jgi:fumarate reductase subunit D